MSALARLRERGRGEGKRRAVSQSSDHHRPVRLTSLCLTKQVVNLFLHLGHRFDIAMLELPKRLEESKRTRNSERTKNYRHRIERAISAEVPERENGR